MNPATAVSEIDCMEPERSRMKAISVKLLALVDMGVVSWVWVMLSFFNDSDPLGRWVS